MLRLFGVGEGVRLKEVMDAFEPQLSPEHLPALLMLAVACRETKLLKNVPNYLETKALIPRLNVRKECVDIVAAASGDQEVVKRLKSKIEREVPEAHLLLKVADGKTLVEVLTPISPAAQLAFMLLAAVAGRVDAVRLHGLWGSVAYGEPLARRLFRAVYENCGDLNSEGCRLALLKLYYYHI